MAFNPFLPLLQQGMANIPLPPGGGNGGGIVPTPEQIAASEAAAAQLGYPADIPQGEEIIVDASRRAPQAIRPPDIYSPAYSMDPEEVPDLGNTAWAQAALKANQENEKNVQHKGLFGMKGTLRDVLGILGDAFLVQGGRNQIYAPGRSREMAGDAMAGATQAPLAAAERLYGLGQVELGNQVANDYADNQYKAQNAQSQAEARQSMIEDRTRRSQEAGLKMVGRWVNANAPYQQIVAGARMYGISAEQLAMLGVTPDMTPEQRQAIAASDFGVNQQESMERRDRSLDQGDQRIGISQGQLEVARRNADTAYQRMLKSGSSGSRPRADTELEYFRALEAVPAAQRSAEENAWVQKYTGQNSGRRSNRRPINTPASSSNGPRVLRVRPAN